VVCSAFWVQARVCEVPEVADQPGWDAVVGSGGNLQGVGAGEALEHEGVCFLQGGLDAALEEWELVVAFFFVRVTEDRWLFVGC
jgi:hypothetical protein